MIKTTELFWDCECPENYIHYKSLEQTCPHCNTHHDDQPDSRPSEISFANISVESEKLIKDRIEELNIMMDNAFSVHDSAELLLLENIEAINECENED